MPNRPPTATHARLLTGIRWPALVLAVAALLVGAVGPASAATREGDGGLDLDRLRVATVLITADPDDPEEAGWGSGSIISADGLILTNAHVAANRAPGVTLLYPHVRYEATSPATLYVYTVDGAAGQASPAYRAEVVAADGYLDLAVLRIVARADGARVDTGELDLPAVPIGRGRELRPLDELVAAGFPGIADTFAVRFSKGEVHNFADDPRIGPEAWIHTDAKIAEGNSGGLAVDASGHLVAVPTAIQSDGPDGVVDYIMRPVELALPLIEAARAGEPYDGYTYLTRPSGRQSARVQGWATEATDECVEGVVDAALPSGTWELFPQVAFEGMSPGDPVLVELVEMTGGSELRSLPTSPWTNGLVGLVELFAGGARGHARHYEAFDWEAEWGSSACLPFEMWYDRLLPSHQFRSFRDADYEVRVWVGFGPADESEITEDPRLTAATVGPMLPPATTLSAVSGATTHSAGGNVEVIIALVVIGGMGWLGLAIIARRRSGKEAQDPVVPRQDD
jgi:S1-C subfamily serine protease